MRPKPKPQPTISTAQIIAGEIPPDTLGIYWTDTNLTDCRDHLASDWWRQYASPNPALTGIVLTQEPINCDACKEEAEDKFGSELTDSSN